MPTSKIDELPESGCGRGAQLCDCGRKLNRLRALLRGSVKRGERTTYIGGLRVCERGMSAQHFAEGLKGFRQIVEHGRVGFLF